MKLIWDLKLKLYHPIPEIRRDLETGQEKKMNEHERDACIHYYKWTWNITEEPRDGLGRIGISGKNCKHHYQARIVRRLKHLGVVVSFNHQ